MYLKVLVGGKSSHGGDLEWNLPHDGLPGDWHEMEEDVEPREYGLHYTDDKYIGDWLKLGCQVYEIEPVKSELVRLDTYVSRKARLVREVDSPMWWQAGTGFLRHAQSMTFFDNHEQPNIDWRVFDTREQALKGMHMYGSSDINFYINRARGEMFCFERTLYRKSVIREFAGEFTYSWNEDPSFISNLYAMMLMFEDVLSQNSKKYIERLWEVYMRGYGCVGDVNGVLFVYKKLGQRLEKNKRLQENFCWTSSIQ